MYSLQNIIKHFEKTSFFDIVVMLYEHQQNVDNVYHHNERTTGG